jgi:hypothetical protein
MRSTMNRRRFPVALVLMLVACVSTQAGKARSGVPTQRDSTAQLAAQTPSRPTYKVTVDYDQPLSQAIAAGGYDFVYEYITPENFPPARKGKVTVEIAVIDMGRNATADEILAELDRRGFRPANLQEFLTYGAENHVPPPRKVWTVALGSGWRSREGDRYVPVLIERPGRRSLDLIWPGPRNAWTSGTLFAAVRK